MVAPLPDPVVEPIDSGTPPYTERLSFPIHRLSAQMARIVNPLFREYDVDLVSSRVLVHALERGAIGAGELVSLLSLPQSTVSHQLQRLERLGYIERRRLGADQRVVSVTLTERGQVVAEACNRVSIDVYEAMIARLSPGQIAQCRETMELMLAALDDLV